MVTLDPYPILPDTVAAVPGGCWVSPGEAWMVPGGIQQIEAGLDLHFLSQHGWFRALWVDETPVWLVGIHRLWPGVGLIWQHVVVPAVVQTHRHALLRLLHREWQTCLAAEDWRWIESQILATDSVSARFLRWLGFRIWTSKPGYGPLGETVHVYVWRTEVSQGT
jgi:hypothetical protein